MSDSALRGPFDEEAKIGGLVHPGVLDLMVHDEKRGVLVLAMFERRPWDGGDEQLWQLQEKLNAYASFALDGELAGEFPQMKCLPIVIQLRTLHEPSAAAMALIEQARAQLAFQEIALEIWLTDIQPDSAAFPKSS